MKDKDEEDEERRDESLTGGGTTYLPLLQPPVHTYKL